MSAPELPELPAIQPGEVLFVGTAFDDGLPRWDQMFRAIGGRREADTLLLEDGKVRLRITSDPRWENVSSGSLPALVPAGAAPAPVMVVADIGAVYGGRDVLLVDLQQMPGRGARIAMGELGTVLGEVLDGTLRFDDLVHGMDVDGCYRGGGGRPAFPVPTEVVRTGYPMLPDGGSTIVVRTYFGDEAGWRSLLAEFGGVDEDGRVGADLDPDEIDVDDYPLTALVVDDRRYEDLQPGQVPALIPPGEGPTLVALADARACGEPGRPLSVVDVHDTPGLLAVLPRRMVGSMDCNLELANMDFAEFVAVDGAPVWWEQG
ncbi:DUF6924 domain-containing protein [Catenulispora pinisilvae]|uniref:DUF6924 domain-containing protein n=1 Tax=Catenulispora pinisilvae TaxID=2705253 RepID=UPI0018918E4B|nr:hypothetical protein [Catenulispora pinisilvae]